MTTKRTGFSTAEVFWDKGETLSVRVGGVSMPTVSTAEVPGTLLRTSFWVELMVEVVDTVVLGAHVLSCSVVQGVVSS